MPNIKIPVPGVKESVIRPTLVEITDQVLSFLGLKETIKDVRYVSHSGDVRMPSSGLTERGNDYASFAGTNRAWVEIEDDVFKDGWTVSRPSVIDTQPLFLDKNLQVGIWPFMEAFQATIKIRFSTHSYDSARQPREALLSRIASLEDGIQHKVDFSVGIHDYLICLLQDIWLKRELRAGHGETFEEYIANHSTSGLTTVSEASGQEVSLVYKRRMGRINGYFVVSEIPEKPVYQGENSVWEFSVEYRVNYDVPNQMQVQYPIMVHNQYLHRAFLQGLQRQQDIRDSQSNLSLSQAAASIVEFGKAEGNNLLQDLYFNIPDIDHFEPNVTPRNTATVFIALLSINSDPKVPLLNLSDLGTIYIDEDILDFFRKVEWQYLTKIFESFFYVHMYENGLMMAPETLRCDENLNVYTTVPLDPRKTYRVRLCMPVDTNVLPVDVLNRIWGYPKAVAKTVKAINSSVFHYTDFFDIRGTRKLEPWMLNPLWNILTGRNPPPQTDHGLDASNRYDESNVGKDGNIEFGNGYEYPGNGSGDGNPPDDFRIPGDWIGVHRSGINGHRTVQIQSLIIHRK